MAVFSISTPINQCYCLCHHGNWTCCISLRSGGVFHNSQTDGSRGCSRSASPPSAKSAPRETQNPPLSASPSTHDRLTAAPPPPPHHSRHYGLRDYITATTVWVSSHKATVYIIGKKSLHRGEDLSFYSECDLQRVIATGGDKHTLNLTYHKNTNRILQAPHLSVIKNTSDSLQSLN